MLKLLTRSIRDFRASFQKLLVFEYLYMLLTSVIVVPSITYIFNRILTVIGSGSLLNSEVYRLGLSYEGAIGLVLIGLVASFALFIELCVLVTMIQQRYFGKQIAITDALLTTLRRTPRLFGFGIVQLLAMLLLLIPFIDSPLSESFYALFNFPIFINNWVLDASFTMTFVYAVLVVAILYTVMRWIFVLHFIVLEGKSIAEAIRASIALTRGKKLKLFITLFFINAAVVAAGVVVIAALSYLPAWLNINVLKAFTNHYSLTLSTILTYMLALLILPINLIFLTRLYYFLGRDNHDRLTVYRSRLGRLEQRITVYLTHWKRKRFMIVGAVAFYLGIALFVGFKASDSLVYAKWTVTISAHRGDAESAPENSLPSITAAAEKGIQSVELDVQLTKDGVAVLHHDFNLKRMAGTAARVSELNYSELSKLPIGENEHLEPVYIPTLAEALVEAQGRTKLLLDLKPYGPSEELVKEVVAQVKGLGMEQEVYIQSFDSATLRQIRDLAPEIKIGQILFFAFGDLTTLDVDFYTVETMMLTDQLVERAHTAGREIWVWTVNSKRNMKEVLKFQVDGIITDYPAIAQSMVELNL
ncbi:glycerophosphodiester phosphodiesterase family protein [Paenibacillus sp. NPDC058071]|uniref:glycerophosphodiester phosphodiesterase family protein n=1 Tax=Paenibacillus sp. NPDC058071 TaxID=3346326 RepID=UPI0036D998FC